jgi:alpha-L-fucosidase 2
LVSDAVECELLPALPESWKDGSLTGVSLKGNLKLDVSWKNGALESARIYAKNEANYMDSVIICYKGKRYDARINGGSLNVMNILPTTV